MKKIKGELHYIKEDLRLKDGKIETYTIENEKNDVKELRVNIIKSVGVPYESIKDFFVIEIDKAILEDDYLDPDKLGLENG